MSEAVQVADARDGVMRWSPGGTYASFGLALVAAALDFVVVIVATLLAGSLYYRVVLGSVPPLTLHLAWGGATAVSLALVTTLRGNYRVDAHIREPRHLLEIWLNWTIAIGLVAFEMFLLKSSIHVSRGATLVLYVLGFPMIVLSHYFGRSLFGWASDKGLVRARRILVIGSDRSASQRVAARLEEAGLGDVRQILFANLADPYADALRIARHLEPDDIVLSFPLDDTRRVEQLVDVLFVVPAAMHFAPEGSRTGALSSSRIGSQFGIPLIRAPLEPWERLAKRSIDVVLAGTLLLLLAPYLLLVALAIRIDSSGPALFRQTRYGYNQKTFRIFKFRTMSVAEDGNAFRQARRNDPRVTRIGRLLRRTNIDELPQLLNVLTGTMSIVGPRPHPVALDDSFDKRIDYYSRRHAVKPGITGWAQVHGLRGETDTAEKMRARVEYDLDYLDKWSIGMDFQIILMTAFSRSAYRNAC